MIKSIFFKEIIKSIRNPYQWIYLGYFDIVLRYKKSIIGPWWIVISTSLMISALSFLWSKVLNFPLNEYIIYFTTGYIFWHWFSMQISESLKLTVEFSSIIKNLKISYFIFCLRLIIRNLIIYLHNFLLILLIAFLFGNFSEIAFIWFLFGLIFNVVLIFFMVIFISLMAMRFSDFEQLVISGLQLLFFFSPIIWMKDSIKGNFMIIEYNPIFHMIEIIRNPFLGIDVSTYYFSYFFLLIILFIFIFLSYLTFNKFKESIVYWV